ncbi:MAG TPA: formate dehydrogenase subunit delta [Acidocella sp.]|nr:formate dehydrogenase subunit delta [Acidocella sp.]
MSHTIDRLVYMANQIGKAFDHLPRQEAVNEIAEHIKYFWEKRMLAQIYAHIDAGAKGLDDLPKQSLGMHRKLTS